MECPHIASEPRGYLQNVLNYRDVNIVPNNAAKLLKIVLCYQKKYFKVTIHK